MKSSSRSKWRRFLCLWWSKPGYGSFANQHHCSIAHGVSPLRLGAIWHRPHVAHLRYEFISYLFFLVLGVFRFVVAIPAQQVLVQSIILREVQNNPCTGTRLPRTITAIPDEITFLGIIWVHDNALQAAL